MVYLAEPSVFVAVGVPYDIYFVSGRYFYMHGANWFWEPGFGSNHTAIFNAVMGDGSVRGIRFSIDNGGNAGYSQSSYILYRMAGRADGLIFNSLD